jgi:hypothetical protein
MVTLSLIPDDEFQSLVDDCIAIITEAEFTSRWARVEGYHALGKRIATDRIWNQRGNGETLSRVTKFTGIKERNLYRAVQFYEMYPNLNLLPEGKNVSWHKICNDYLPEPRDDLKDPEPETCICPDCGQVHRKKLE